LLDFCWETFKNPAIQKLTCHYGLGTHAQSNGAVLSENRIIAITVASQQM
jgi:hypothetical protein